MLLPGQIRVRGVSRRFRVVHDRSLTLKETLIRRQRARYSELWALRDVDLDVAPGEAVAIVGRNGSGKSTLLKMLAGIVPPHEGIIQAGGTVASMLELGAGFHPDFTGRENVFMNGAIHGLSEKEVRARLDEIVDFSELEEFIDMPVRTYSSGMQMRLAFAVASHVNPSILLLDEVLAVGDEAFQRKCLGRIHRFLDGGGTLVFVSHDPNAVQQVCSRAVLIEQGRVTNDGDPSDVLEAYHRLLVDQPVRGHAKVTEPRSAGASEDPVGRRWGTGAARITSCRLTDGTGGEKTAFQSGEPLFLEIDFATTRPMPLPSFGVMIHSLDGTLIFGTNTGRSAFDHQGIVTGGTMRLAIPINHLHEGSFEFTVACGEHDESEVFDWLDRWVRFDVFARSRGIGLVDLGPEWSYEPLRVAHHA